MKEQIIADIEKAMIDGKLPCIKAFEIAEKYNVKPIQVGKYANQIKAKIAGCQLGCFK
jgi:uncharacterized protein YjcR